MTKNLERYSAASIKAYASDFRIFERFCKDHSLCALPTDASTVVAFVESEAAAGHTKNTLARRVAAIRYTHRQAGLHCPDRDSPMQAIISATGRRNSATPNQATPLTADRLDQVLALCDDTIVGRRDRALISIGFAAALRRSEIVALCVEDLRRVDGGLMILIRRSKGDQAGIGQEVFIPKTTRIGVVKAIDDWLRAGRITHGPIFRRISTGGSVGRDALHPDAMRRILAKYIVAIGLNPDDFSPHSLRSGFLTSAAESGASVLQMIAVSRHATFNALQVYIRNPRVRGHAGDEFL